MVPGGGLEPARGCPRRNLSPLLIRVNCYISISYAIDARDCVRKCVISAHFLQSMHALRPSFPAERRGLSDIGSRLRLHVRSTRTLPVGTAWPAFNMGIETMQMIVVALIILPSLLLMSRTPFYRGASNRRRYSLARLPSLGSPSGFSTYNSGRCHSEPRCPAWAIGRVRPPRG
jgi:hypothetical protein